MPRRGAVPLHGGEQHVLSADEECANDVKPCCFTVFPNFREWIVPCLSKSERRTNSQKRIPLQQGCSGILPCVLIMIKVFSRLQPDGGEKRSLREIEYSANKAYNKRKIWMPQRQTPVLSAKWGDLDYEKMAQRRSYSLFIVIVQAIMTFCIETGREPWIC